MNKLILLLITLQVVGCATSNSLRKTKQYECFKVYGPIYVDAYGILGAQKIASYDDTESSSRFISPNAHNEYVCRLTNND